MTTTTTPKSEATRVLDAICSQQWAIVPEMLETMVAIATRTNEVPEALLSSKGESLRDTERVIMRDGVAVLPIHGPVFRYANLFSQMSGATSIDVLATDLQTALDNPAVEAIVLDFDTPGGQVAGTSEFAGQIKAAAAVKPVIAYVSHMASSAGYWMASAANEIIINDTAQVGSIGVLIAARREDDGVIRVISSQSPRKFTQPDSEAGLRDRQAVADSLAEVFITQVAANRGVSVETVLSDFGQGTVLVGADAVAAGMADRLGSLESIIAGLTGSNPERGPRMNDKTRQPVAITRELIVADYPDIAAAFRAEGAAAIDITAELVAEKHPAIAATFRSEGADAERARIQAVQAQALPGYEAQITTMMFDGKTSGPEAAVAILGLEKATRDKQLESLGADAGAIDIVKDVPAPGAEPSAETLPLEERCKAAYEKDETIRADFPTLESYVRYEKACAAGKVRVVGGNK